jgi:D-glycero-alpha-D-manno-heptose 1-phosphate guanylyltransferase
MNKVTEAIILAGGQGTRLRPVVSNVPKPMADIAGEPFLAHLIKLWSKCGINSFTISTGYLGYLIKDYFGAKFFGCDIRYSTEEFPLGTGGGLRRALTTNTWKSPNILLLNGDTWFEVDIKKLMFDSNQAGNQLITVALKPMPENERYGSVLVDASNKITNFKGAPDHADSACLINGGCYLLSVKKLVKYLIDFPDTFSLESDLLMPLSLIRKVSGSIQDRAFLDIGTPKDYMRAAEIISQQNT